MRSASTSSRLRQNRQGRVRIPDPAVGVQPVRGTVAAAPTLVVEGDGGIPRIDDALGESGPVDLLDDADRVKTRAVAGMEVWVTMICGDPT